MTRWATTAAAVGVLAACAAPAPGLRPSGPLPQRLSPVTITSTGLEPGKAYDVVQCAGDWCGYPTSVAADDRGVLQATLTVGESYRFKPAMGDIGRTATCGTAETGFACSLIVRGAPAGATASFPLVFDTGGTTFDIGPVDPVGAPGSFAFRATGLVPSTDYFIDQCQGVRCEGGRPEQRFTTDGQGVLSGTTTLRTELGIWDRYANSLWGWCPDRDINAEPCSVRVIGPGLLPAPRPTRLPGPGGVSPRNPSAEAGPARVRTTGLEPNRSYHLAQCVLDLCGVRTPVTTAADGSLDATVVLSNPFTARRRQGDGSEVSLWCSRDASAWCEVRILPDADGIGGSRSFRLAFDTGWSSLTLTDNWVRQVGDRVGVAAHNLRPGERYRLLQCFDLQCDVDGPTVEADANGSLTTTFAPALSVTVPDLDSGAPTTRRCPVWPGGAPQCTVRLAGPGPLPEPQAIVFDSALAPAR